MNSILETLSPINPALIVRGDALTVLQSMPGASVDCIVTSPPYWGLRDYEHPGQIGLEVSPESYLSNLVGVFNECLRTLKPHGSLWLVMGDSYDKGKGLLGMPWRLAFKMIESGWVLRSDIIWHKPSANPESVKDRPIKAHEYVFQFVKQPNYYYDWYNVREPATGRHSGNKRTRASEQPNNRNQTRKNFPYDGCSTRNIRDVWTITSKGYKGAHFACFPPELVKPIVNASLCVGGYCRACGMPQKRKVVSKRIPTRPGTDNKAKRTTSHGANLQEGNRDPKRHVTEYISKGFAPQCECEFPFHPGILLDPFAGTGTAVAVAIEHRHYGIAIELSKPYAKLARERIGKSVELLGTEYLTPKILEHKHGRDTAKRHNAG